MRLPEADPAASPALAAAFAAFRRTRGIVSNIMKSFAHAPEGLSAIVELGRYCRYGTDLTELQKELVILITGRGIDYAWHHHAPLGRQAGLSEAQLDALRAGGRPEGLSETDAALCDYVFAYAALKGVPQPLFDRIAALLTPRQITDINIIAGYYLCIASSIIGMEVQPDPPALRDAGTAFHSAGERG
jgi:4-carboxymuconolactone decarboxylase